MESPDTENRRDLKIKYLDLLKKIRLNKDALVTKGACEMDDLIKNTESLFLQIKKPCDLNLDAKISTESARISSESFEKQCMSDRMTSDGFIDLVLRHREAGDPRMDDYLQFARSRFVGVEFVHQLCLNPISRVANQRQRNTPVSVDTVADLPQRVFSTKDDDGTLTLVKKIKKVVHGRRSVDYYELVIDPGSYSKTIENIFYLAFAIKVGFVHFAAAEGRFMVFSDKPEDRDEELDHLIVSIEYSEYCILVKNLKIEKALLS